MTRLWLEGVPLQLTLNAQNNPMRFRWQGQSHRIEQIWRRWQIDSDWWSEEGRIWREYLLITTQDGLLCMIYQDLSCQEWYFVRFYN